MTGSDDFPLPALPDAELPSRGFEQAWQQGRRRRRRSLLASGGSSAALGAAVLLALVALPGTSERGDSLQQLGPAGTGEVPSRVAPPTAGPLPSTLGPAALPKLPKLPKLPGLPRTSPSPSSSPTSAAGAEQQRTPGEGSPSRPVEREYSSPVPYADAEAIAVGGNRYSVCSPGATRRPSGTQARWCGGNDVENDRAGDLTLRHHECRAHDGDQPALTFATTQEVEYEVRSASGARLWRWSERADVRSAPHELLAEPGGCYEWSTLWTPLSPSGSPLPAGRYVLRSWVTSDQLGAAAAQETSFEVRAS